jgi:hypothetical protein
VARPYKNNLDSIILDLNFDQQREIKYIESRHGLTGFAIAAKLLIYILRQGYYISWTEEVQGDFMIYTNTDKEVIELIIACAIDAGLFDAEIYNAHKVLTSKNLQEVFLKVCERRKSVQLCKEYILIDISKYNNIVIAYRNPINVDNNPVNDNKNIVNVDNNLINVSNNYINNDNNSNTGTIKISSMFDDIFENQ